ncbi:MAG: class I SAM-dependent methyltransferase [Azonexus sp.]|jgi:hypothetical protein|nr:class I SAM-dependent methyltransferase [Azonexus sp.]
MFASPLRQFALQGAAVILVLSLAWPYFGWRAEAVPWRETSLVIGAVALLLAALTRQPWWWRLMHGGFMPLVWATGQLAIDPGWFLLAFILLLLVYRGALSGRIPLYLSNRQTVAALDALIERENPQYIFDLGAGLGSTLIPLADAWPDRRFAGIENAPASWLLSRLLGLGRPNLKLGWGDLWRTPLAEQDLVYAFLSPAPMARLWQKAKAEMPPGSLFISNSFPVPDVACSELIEAPGSTPRSLYCYRM